ncbi:hypothetical protein GCM10007887_40810 [Methylobacterium haplocladii]|uniref:Integrase catalytic domain-containing protein n=1 Tax=Methylobacterium haplocladii TaxID=1176176 RepID=A0A512IW84_9HYPH|nr:hypothetical protein MHA02_43200 [Methylobacterium haplocladii]GJD86395.1 hypothetical protein HPGCJGGD_4301 [Methylobacterium haplocladii]GLS61373.1 hypothetical protein GCM10007887_40810 [Methylobacterium haplocladii]
MTLERVALQRALGKPRQTVLVESFNERLRNRCLHDYRFGSLLAARAIVEPCGSTTIPPELERVPGQIARR